MLDVAPEKKAAVGLDSVGQCCRRAAYGDRFHRRCPRQGSARSSFRSRMRGDRSPHAQGSDRGADSRSAWQRSDACHGELYRRKKNRNQEIAEAATSEPQTIASSRLDAASPIRLPRCRRWTQPPLPSGERHERDAGLPRWRPAQPAEQHRPGFARACRSQFALEVDVFDHTFGRLVSLIPTALAPPPPTSHFTQERSSNPATRTSLPLTVIRPVCPLAVIVRLANASLVDTKRSVVIISCASTSRALLTTTPMEAYKPSPWGAA